MNTKYSKKIIILGVLLSTFFSSPSYSNDLSDRDMLAAYCVGYYVAEFEDPELYKVCAAAERGEHNICSPEVVKRKRLLGYLGSTGALENEKVWAIANLGKLAYRDCISEANSDEAIRHTRKCGETHGVLSEQFDLCAQSLVLPSCEPLEPCQTLDFLPF
jgi:hypothetical protein